MVIDQVQEQDNKLYGTHWHRMSYASNTQSINELQINNWSLGCMGSPVKEYDKILGVTRESVKLYGTKFTGTILESTDF